MKVKEVGLKLNIQDFPGGPGAKAPRSQCSGPQFNPWSGNYISHVSTKTQCSQINNK